MSNPVYQLLLDAFILFLKVGTLLSLIFGLCLSWVPEPTLRFSRRLSRTISMRRATRPLEIPITGVEKVFYRHNRLMGVLMLIADLYLLYMFSLGIDFPAVEKHPPGELSVLVWSWLLQSARICFLLFGIVIGAFAFTVLLRPSLLKRVEEVANHWVSTRQAFRRATSDISLADRWVERYPRSIGAAIVVLALAVLGMLSLGFSL